MKNLLDLILDKFNKTSIFQNKKNEIIKKIFFKNFKQKIN